MHFRHALSFDTTSPANTHESGPSRATAGYGKLLSRGPHNLIPYAPRSRRQRRRKETWGGVSPHHPTIGSGQHHKLPQRGRKWIFCTLEVRKKPSGTLFAEFLHDGGAPNVAGPRNIFPLFSSPLAEPVTNIGISLISPETTDCGLQLHVCR